MGPGLLALGWGKPPTADAADFDSAEEERGGVERDGAGEAAYDADFSMHGHGGEDVEEGAADVVDCQIDFAVVELFSPRWVGWVEDDDGPGV